MLDIVKNDKWLTPFSEIIEQRHEYILDKEQQLIADLEVGTLSDFATGYLYFGLHKEVEEWVLREWAPNATAIYLLHEQNGFSPQSEYRFVPQANGVWELRLPKDNLNHGDHYKLFMEWEGGSGERIPAWARYVVQDPETHIFTAVVWAPEESFAFEHMAPVLGDQPLLIYEAHVGMATEAESVGTYKEFKERILPKVKEKGYNAIQLMAIMEHPYYGSFGYQVSSLYAPSSRFGTPDELKELIDEAHRLGILVIMDLVHSHAVRNEVEGIARYDGSYTQFFHDGDRMIHPQWNSMCFDYGKNEVIHFLLSNCKYWLEEFNFDGFRFDGVTSMLYYDHGLEKNYCTYNDYYDGGQDIDAITYLTLANKVIHEVRPDAVTIAEEVSGMPGLALGIEEGGYGFDYRLAMNIPDFWIKLIKEQPDELWKPGSIWWECTNRRADEKTISYAESHDQALVGDKTIIFRLIDKEMYWHMNKDDHHPAVERGVALHKMIRLVTLTTMNGGYLNFMGNEFGHPEWIDFPREGNGWSYKYARRQWSLEENGFLRYEQLSDFDQAMVEHVLSQDDYASSDLTQLWSQEEDQVLAYQRQEYVYVYNFHPTESHVDYKILAPIGEYEQVLSTDEKRFGGYDLVDPKVHHFTSWDEHFTADGKGWLSLYIPSRTAMILKRIRKNRNE
ncbi:MAG: alpha amylase C-terminal domain-containing protein [Porphyromonas sp.]|nr:alpha amylase C-terminal domain-containing protein [Porphyromonas sp.]